MKTNELAYLKALLYCLQEGSKLFGTSEDYHKIYQRLEVLYPVIANGVETESVKRLALDAFAKPTLKSDTLHLRSILTSVKLIDKAQSNECNYVSAIEQGVDERVSFTTTNPPSPSEYQSIWGVMTKHLLKLMPSTPHQWTESALMILETYATVLPFSTEHADTSFYDWTRTIMGLSACESEEYSLIGGDISGIQDYIYRITSKYAAKNLKGRSFYIKILTDAVVRKILERIGLFRANIVYSSGGGFYILAPRKIDKQIEALVSELEKGIFKSHGTDLYVAIDAVPLELDELPRCWTLLFEKLNRKKQSRFAHLITNNPELFFMPFEDKEGLRDTITGELFNADEEEFNVKRLGSGYQDLQDAHLRPLTGLQILLGQWLKDHQVMAVSREKINEVKSIEVAHTGYYYTLLSKVEKDKLPPNTSLIYFNQIDLDNEDIIGDISYSREYYGGNMYYDGQTFEELCDSDKGLRRLGVLRMDVDNLGAVFQRGLGDSVSLARYSALSRHFDYFFSGYINTIHRQYRDSTFVVYSGGDDLFVVGDWEDTFAFAASIQSSFKKFTSGAPSFSISGGIAFVPPKYPILKGAERSAEEEERAKAYRYLACEKNAISLLGTPINWVYEYKEVMQVISEVARLTRSEALPRSFIAKVLKLHTLSKMKDHQVKNFAFYWMANYDLARLRSTVKKQEGRELISMCIKDISDTQEKTFRGVVTETAYHPLELWALVCRYTELLIREGNNK